MTTEARFERQLPRHPARTCTWGRLPTIETRSWPSPSARGSARPGPSQEGGSPWHHDFADRPTLMPRVPWRAIVWPRASSSPAARRRGRRRSSVRDRHDFRRRSGRPATDSSSTRADGDIYTVDPRTGVTTRDRHRPGGRPPARVLPRRDQVLVRPARAPRDCCMSYDIVVAARRRDRRASHQRRSSGHRR